MIVNRTPLVFGLADGSMSVVGVVLFVSGHGGSVFPVALAGGISAAISMAGGEWLADNESGPATAAWMGAATLAGSVLPAVPFLFLHGWKAVAVSAVLLAGVAYAVARLRGHREHPYLETFGVLAAVLAASIGIAVAVPGSG